MNNNDLTERYIYAVTKQLPHAIRKDVAKELFSLVGDMLEERCGELVPTDKDVRMVLTELGTPTELAQKYSQDATACLIGQPYYSQYKFVLKIVLFAVTLGLVVSGVVSVVMGNTGNGFVAAAKWIAELINGLATAFAFVTLLFAFFYRKGIALDINDDSLNSLPPIPQNKYRIGKVEPIVDIILAAVFTAVFLFAPQVLSAYIMENGVYTVVPVFGPELARYNITIIMLGVIGIFKGSVALLEGAYTPRFMRVALIANLFSGALWVAWLYSGKVINPAFIDAMKTLFSSTNDTFLVTTFSNVNRIFLAFVLFALVLDTGDALYKWYKSRQ
ncbi:MAG: hypothetical protein RSF82_10330 [Angelakisella sp.]